MTDEIVHIDKANKFAIKLEEMQKRHRREALEFVDSVPLKGSGNVIGLAVNYANRLKHIDDFDIVKQGFIAPLSKKDLDAVAAYVWSVGHARNQ